MLLLEAGKYQDTSKILHSMEWPYDHPRRGRMPSDHHALTLNEYNVRELPYAQNSPYNKVQSYVQGWSGTDYSKTLVVDENKIHTPARAMLGCARAPLAARRTSGAAWRCAFPITISKPKTAMVMAKIGPSLTQTLSRITTRSIFTLASRATRKIFPTCQTANFNGR